MISAKGRSWSLAATGYGPRKRRMPPPSLSCGAATVSGASDRIASATAPFNVERRPKWMG